MRPYLIVDFSARTLCALAITPDFRVLPLSQEIHQVVTRYFSSELLLDPRLTDDPEFPWEEAFESLTTTGARGFFSRARRLGLWRPWDRVAPANAVRLDSALALLSSPAALVDPLVRPVLPGAAILLLDALLDPVFSSFSELGFASRAAAAFAVVPVATGRHARLALHKVFRRRGFPGLTILPRPLAAAMALVEEPAAEALVWDVTGDDLSLHRVKVEPVENGRRFQTVAARTARGLGWPFWVRQIGAALGAHGRIPQPPGPLLTALDRALTGLLSGSPEASELPASPPLRLTCALLQEVFDGERLVQLSAELRRLLGPQLAALGAGGLPVILLGAVCGHEPFQTLVLSLLGGSQPLPVAQKPALERAVRGVAAALLWLGDDPGRSVTVLPAGGLRLNTLGDEACELLACGQLPGPGEPCHLQQRLRITGGREKDRTFLVHLLWGADPSPQGNASLCAMPVDRELDGNGTFRLALRLQRSRNGRWLSGAIEVGPESGTPAGPPARTSFATDLASSCHFGAVGRRDS
jgi:hypothetical protein